MKSFFTGILFLFLTQVSFPQTPCYTPKSGFIDEVFNVRTEGAKGDGITDDTDKLQAALDKILDRVEHSSCERGGAVYFPQGIYLIRRPLKIPPRCILFGLSGVFTQSDIYKDVSKIYKHQPVVIRLADNSNCNMVEPYLSKDKKFVPYESVIIDGICFDGNREKQTTPDLKGIYMPDASEDIRPNLKLKDVFIFRVKGSGFHAGVNNSEYEFENVLSDENEKDGFFFDRGGSDVSFYRTGAGGNRRDGFHFESCSTFRLINCDTWGNRKNGINIYNCLKITFNILTSAVNFETGARIEASAMINFVNADFAANSRVNWEQNHNTPQFPEVDLYPNVNGYGIYGTTFIGCKFGSMDPSQKALYAVRDNANIIRNIPFLGCTFVTKSFENNSICNKEAAESYTFQSCMAGLEGERPAVQPVKFRTFNSINSNNTNVHLTPEMNVLTVNTASFNVSVILPRRSEVPVGKEFTIIKTSMDHEIEIVAGTGDIINDSAASLPITGGPYLARKIINAEDRWILAN